jgi:uncharacterized protein (TIGR02118 family)
MAKFPVKRLGMVRRKASLTHEQFLNHWLTTHAELCKRLPGLRRYSINLVNREKSPKFDYDGFSELWFDSIEAYDAAMASPEGSTLLADLPNFVDQIDPVLVEERQMLWP